ncbi:MAG: Fe-S biogenesis protein NfuA [Porticoccaceae bacterium]|jgi:Fe/S biogenesis protein NfuA|nr:Fe-S biogenesis protein NfuA [Gammaproteobacteria bacterium]TAL05095.1 MAG: Fe-S biogenesis protein NfuA [Porticoccaceae bacterium]
MAQIEITPSAQVYLAGLLAKQNCEGIAIRLFVADPGTPKAETCIAYCRPGEEQPDDQILELDGLRAHVEKRSLPFLEDAKVDYAEDRMGGQLTIRAPNSRMPRIGDDSPLEDKINYVLYNEVNPGLAAHGGQVSLEDIVDNVAVLQFGGGCQGCGMVDVTLKEGVEKTLMSRIPELSGVRDVTDHTDTSHAFYK